MNYLRKGIKHKNKEIVQVFEKYYDSMLIFGGRISTNRELVEDCIQDLFLKFCENQDLILHADNQEAYLKASLRRALLKKMKAERSDDTGISNLLEIAVPSYEDILIRKQKTLQDSLDVKAALSLLTQSQKTILTLRFYRSMSYDDIANKLGISKRTVYNQIHDSMKKLKKLLHK